MSKKDCQIFKDLFAGRDNSARLFILSVICGSRHYQLCNTMETLDTPAFGNIIAI